MKLYIHKHIPFAEAMVTTNYDDTFAFPFCAIKSIL